MGNINKFFKSNYISAADLDGEDVTVTIAGVQTEEVGKDREEKPVIYFEEFENGMVLNKTNANAIAQVLNSFETDDWAGRKITLCTAVVDFQGKSMEAIRVKLRAPRPQTAGTGAAPAARQAGGGKAKPSFAKKEEAAAAPITDDDPIPF